MVGGGPAGLSAAHLLSSRGHNITLWEEESQLGGSFRYASMAPRKEPMRNFLDYLINQVKKTNTQVHLNKEATAESIKQFAADVVILAHGAKHVLVGNQRRTKEQCTQRQECLLFRRFSRK